jgi:DCN1-like protein 1/2
LKTAIYCLSQHDWRLDDALDSYTVRPELYCCDPKPVVDKKKLELAFAKYKGKLLC